MRVHSGRSSLNAVGRRPATVASMFRPCGFAPLRRLAPHTASRCIATRSLPGFIAFQLGSDRSRACASPRCWTPRRIPLAGSCAASLRPCPPAVTTRHWSRTEMCDLGRVIEARQITSATKEVETPSTPCRETKKMASEGLGRSKLLPSPPLRHAQHPAISPDTGPHRKTEILQQVREGHPVG